MSAFLYDIYCIVLVCCEAVWMRVQGAVEVYIEVGGYVEPLELCWYGLLGIEVILVEV